MSKDPDEYGVLGITEPIDPEDVPFEVSRVNHQVSINGKLTLEEVDETTEGERDAEFGANYKRKSREISTREIQIERQIDDSTEAYVALTSPEEALYEWLLPEGVQGDAEIIPHESQVTFHAAPIMYIEAAKINALQNKDRTQIGTLLEWLNGNLLAQPVTLTRAIAIVLRDEHDVEFEEMDSYPR